MKYTVYNGEWAWIRHIYTDARECKQVVCLHDDAHSLSLRKCKEGCMDGDVCVDHKFLS